MKNHFFWMLGLLYSVSVFAAQQQFALQRPSITHIDSQTLLSFLGRQVQNPRVMIPALLAAGGFGAYQYAQYISGAKLSEQKKNLWDKVKVISGQIQDPPISRMELLGLRYQLGKLTNNQAVDGLKYVSNSGIDNPKNRDGIFRLIGHSRTIYEKDDSFCEVCYGLQDVLYSKFELDHFSLLKKLVLRYNSTLLDLLHTASNAEPIYVNVSNWLRLYLALNPDFCLAVQKTQGRVAFVTDQSNVAWGVVEGGRTSRGELYYIGSNIIGNLIYIIINESNQQSASAE